MTDELLHRLPTDATPDTSPTSGEPLDHPVVERAEPPSQSVPRWVVAGPRPRGAAVRSGLVAAAATAGALADFGLRYDGNAFTPFTGAGRLMLGIAPTEGPAAAAIAFLAGLGVHVCVCLMWGALFALIASRRRPLHLAVTAILLATLVYSATRLWLPGMLQLGNAIRATRPQLIVLHALLAGGLWVGTRLAQLASRDA